MQYSSVGLISPVTPLANYVYPNKWLKLQRAGDTFTAYQSNDGATWSLIGRITQTMAKTATVGLFVTSHDVNQYSSVGFDNVSVTGTASAPVVSPAGPKPAGRTHSPPRNSRSRGDRAFGLWGFRRQLDSLRPRGGLAHSACLAEPVC
jgi:hypothetical protein